MFLFLQDKLYQHKMFLTNEGPLFVAEGRTRENNRTAASQVIPKGCLLFLYQHIMFLKDKGAGFAGFAKEVLKSTKFHHTRSQMGLLERSKAM